VSRLSFVIQGCLCVSADGGCVCVFVLGCLCVSFVWVLWCVQLAFALAMIPPEELEPCQRAYLERVRV
jgi:hypothetical protein